MATEVQERPVKDILKDLEQLALRVRNKVDSIDQTDLPGLIKTFKGLDDIVTIVDAIKKVLDQTYDKMSSEIIPQAMEAQEVDSMTLMGRVFYTSTRLYASIPEEKREAGFAWLKEQKMESLIKETVNGQSLSSYVSSYFKDNAKYPPDNCVNIHNKTYTAIRKK